MSSIPSNLGRVSTSMSAQQMLSNLRRTNVELLRVQEQLSTGHRINNPSDDPSAIGSISSLRKILDDFEQKLSNLDRAGRVVDQTDQAFGEISNLLVEAQGIAVSQIGITSDAETRESQATIIDGIIDSMVEIVNRDHQGVHLFSGERSSQSPFVEKFGGYQYVGSRTNLKDNLLNTRTIEINANGADSLGGLSSRVQGTVDLDPNATADTRLANVNGARGQGVKLGTVEVDVNGAVTNVDLSGADTLGDIVDKLNDTLGADGSVSVTADGFTLTAGAGNTITISDVGTDSVAADLGINITATSGATAGGDIDPRLTELSDLSQLGAAVNFAGGLKITNGNVTKTIDTSSVTNIQQLINAVHGADIGVRMEINDAGDGLNLINEVSGTQLSIGENAGGSTAGDLGLRSFSGATELADFNNGLGVRITDGEDDLRIELGDGSTQIDVNLDGATTVQDVLDAINTAGGGDVTAQLAADGNGITLVDNIGGGSDFKVTPLNNSFAAEDLGIKQNAGASATLTGDDVATVQSESVLTHLMALRDALRNNDERAITLAGQSIEADVSKMATERAKVGVRANQITSETERVQQRSITTEALLSDIRDTDYASAITRLTQLQQQLEANLSSSSRMLQLSLLDFLG